MNSIAGGVVREGLALEMNGLRLRKARVPVPALPALKTLPGHPDH